MKLLCASILVIVNIIFISPILADENKTPYYPGEGVLVIPNTGIIYADRYVIIKLQLNLRKNENPEIFISQRDGLGGFYDYDTREKCEKAIRKQFLNEGWTMRRSIIRRNVLYINKTHVVEGFTFADIEQVSCVKIQTGPIFYKREVN